jgi:electron transfer flavoprotein alpha subunit
MSKDIYVVVEQRDGHIAKVGLELIGEATKLAADLGQKVYGILMGDKIKDKAQSIIEYGADGVVLCRRSHAGGICYRALCKGADCCNQGI